ncbi:T9SS type A sorting domain-containing protein [Aestuariibaculum sediminum]|uniref:T9SS type A sorting domain-containing protein n=1 Tax=Aestuariibaculum sediminum TaxID=2770637 RepID=A0A8J6U7C5_9FLAO|nr:T9SS type A sorting domain-containing protein [Aestuariibaculum sediminum]MBD0831778.1 T9SS type A sorting domain-containing protein [Aestuariibaculum sediminum]
MIRQFTYLVLLVSNLTYAQLSVRNDSFVFVKNQVVFVNKDINLNESESRIYLRDSGQLVQGEENERNTGEGELSVYQNGNVDAYEYNYWCSPIGNKNSSADNNTFGISFLNDVIDLTTSTPATFNHSSNYNGTSSPLNIEPYWIWKYIASTGYYGWVHVQGNTTINPGEGFTMKGTSGSSASQRYDFRGKPNTGTIPVQVETGKTSLVGNPYPSALDAAAYIHDSENQTVIDGTLSFWEQDPNVNSHRIRDYQGGYSSYTISADGKLITFTPATFKTYNGDGTINTNSGGTASKSLANSRYLPIGQGFMVSGIASGFVKAKNSHRVFKKENVATDSSTFFKNTFNKQFSQNTSSNKFSKVPLTYQRFRLNIDFNNQYTRQLVETFHENATTGFDYGLEIKTSLDKSLKSDACLRTESQDYLAQALPFDDNTTIPFVVKIANDMPLAIRITDIQNINISTPIYVHDKTLNTYVNLRHQDYLTQIEAGTYSNRFEITFSKNEETLNTQSETLSHFNVFQNNRIAELKIYNPDHIDYKQFQLIDVTGKQVINKPIRSINTNQVFSTKALSNGVYIARILLKDNQIFTKKVVINNLK